MIMRNILMEYIISSDTDIRKLLKVRIFFLPFPWSFQGDLHLEDNTRHIYDIDIGVFLDETIVHVSLDTWNLVWEATSRVPEKNRGRLTISCFYHFVKSPLSLMSPHQQFRTFSQFLEKQLYRWTQKKILKTSIFNAASTLIGQLEATKIDVKLWVEILPFGASFNANEKAKTSQFIHFQWVEISS